MTILFQTSSRVWGSLCQAIAIIMSLGKAVTILGTNTENCSQLTSSILDFDKISFIVEMDAHYTISMASSKKGNLLQSRSSANGY